MQTIRGTSAVRASSIPLAARGGLYGMLVIGLPTIQALSLLFLFLFLSLFPSSSFPSSSLSVLGSRLRDEESGGIGAGLLDSIGDVGKDGQAEVCLASLLGVRTTDDLGAYGRQRACISMDARAPVYKREGRKGEERGGRGASLPYSMACWAWKLLVKRARR